MKNKRFNFPGIKLGWALIPVLLLLVNLSVSAQTTHMIPNDDPDSLEHFLEALDPETLQPLHWNDGDIVMLTSDSEYIITGTIDLYGEVTIMGDPTLPSRPVLRLYDNGLRAKEDSISITIKGINFNGLKENEVDRAPYILRFDQAAYQNYNHIVIEDVEAYNTQGGIQLYKNKNTLYESVTLNRVYFHDMETQWALDPTLNAVKELKITNSTFANVFGVLKNPYFNKDGAGALGLVAQNFVLDHNTFFKIGGNGGALLQINDPNDGSVTLTFTNNIASTVLNDTLARPFLINESAGSFSFSNSTINNFDSERDAGAWNFSAASALANVTTTSIGTDYPDFKDTTSTGTLSLLLPSNSSLQKAGTDGGPIGDPKWSGTSRTVGAGLEAFIENTGLWNPGDIIYVTQDEIITGTIDIYQEVTIMGDPSLSKKPVLRLYDNGFRAKEDSISITIKGIAINGLKENEVDKAPYILRFDQAAFQNYNHIRIEDVEAYNTQGGIQLYKNKNTLYESVTLDKVYFHDMETQWALDPTLNAVKELKITNSTFANVFGVLKNPYFNKDGTGALGLVGQKITVDHNTFYKVGGNGGALLQINDPNDGSVTLNFSNNIASTILNDTLSRPFLINEAAGTFTFNNSTVYNFDSERDAGAWNFSAAMALSNVTATDISTTDPEFKDAESGSFLLASGSALQTAGTDGGAIGDPRWGGTVKAPGTGLEAFIEDITKWNPGDTILVTHDEIITGTIDIYQEVTIMGDPSLDKMPELRFYDNGFRPKEDSINITIMNLRLNGQKEDGSSTAPYVLRFDQASWFNYKNILIENVEAYNFNGGIQLWKNQRKYYEKVTLNKVYFHDMLGDFVIDPRLNVVEDLTITNSTFVNVKGFVKNVYNNNDGAQEFGSVAQNITIDHNTFYNVISDVFIQMNDGTDGSVTLDFTNNIVSTLLENTNSRPFRINAEAGTFTLSNSVVHNFESSREEGIYNLDAVAAAQANVTATDISATDPGFIDAANGDLMLTITSAGLIADTQGTGYIGDPRWLPIIPGLSGAGIHPIPNTPDSLEHFMENISYWNPGDTILLVSPGTYIVNGTIDIYQEVTILGDPTLSVKPELRLFDNGFRAKEDTISITIKGVNFNGLKENGVDRAPYILRFDQAAFKNYNHILIEDVEAWNTQGGVQLYKNKNTLYESVTLNKVYFHDMETQWALDPTLNAVKELKITNSTFANVFGVLKNPYFNKDGAGALGLVAQNITVDHNTFYQVGGNGGALVQINDPNDGSVTFNFTNNIASTIMNDTLARPFLINLEAGAFTFSNSTIHNFDSERDAGAWNFSAASAQTNVTTADISEADPEFLKVEAPYNFTLPLNSALLAHGTNGGPIGDPRWFPEVGVTITALTEVVSEKDEVQMEAVATFGEGSDQTVTWTVKTGYNGTAGDATIDGASGLLTAVAAGEVLVVATSNFSTAYSDSLVVTIQPYIYVETISLKAQNSNGTETTLISSKGGSLSIIGTVLPFDAPDKTITWTLSDEALATFTELNATTIVLTAAATGTVTVTASANDGSGVTGTIEIEMVNQRPVTAITVSGDGGATDVKKGETLQMIATIEPEDADVKEVEWSVDNESVATIDANGLLTAVAPGTVVVTADATDNSFRSGSLSVTVTQVLGFEVSQLATLYPNPAVDFINVSVDGQARVQVVGLSGKVFLTKTINNDARIDVNMLKSGLYVLKVISGDHIETIKFTRQ